MCNNYLMRRVAELKMEGMHTRENCFKTQTSRQPKHRYVGQERQILKLPIQVSDKKMIWCLELCWNISDQQWFEQTCKIGEQMSSSNWHNLAWSLHAFPAHTLICLWMRGICEHPRGITLHKELWMPSNWMEVRAVGKDWCSNEDMSFWTAWNFVVRDALVTDQDISGSPQTPYFLTEMAKIQTSRMMGKIPLYRTCLSSK